MVDTKESRAEAFSLAHRLAWEVLGQWLATVGDTFPAEAAAPGQPPLSDSMSAKVRAECEDLRDRLLELSR